MPDDLINHGQDIWKHLPASDMDLASRHLVGA